LEIWRAIWHQILRHVWWFIYAWPREWHY
jgi:hypothetical protein